MRLQLKNIDYKSNETTYFRKIVALKREITKEQLIEETLVYFNMERPNEVEVIPTIYGLSLFLGVGLDSISNLYSHFDIDSKFIADNLKTTTANTLINQSLLNTINPFIAKMLLSRQGITEVQQVEKTKEISYNTSIITTFETQLLDNIKKNKTIDNNIN